MDVLLVASLTLTALTTAFAVTLYARRLGAQRRRRVAREALERAATTDFAELVPVALTDLADVLAQTGRSSEARHLLTKARELHLAKENAALAAKIEARLSRLRS